jgi:VanZ family protein
VGSAVRPRIAAALAVAMMIAQTILSSMSTLPVSPGSWEGADKVVHAGAWTALGACLALSTARPRWSFALIAVAIAVGFAATDEWHQSFVPGRDASVYDGLADLIGAGVGAAAATWYGRRRWRSAATAA